MRPGDGGESPQSQTTGHWGVPPLGMAAPVAWDGGGAVEGRQGKGVAARLARAGPSLRGGLSREGSSVFAPVGRGMAGWSWCGRGAAAAWKTKKGRREKLGENFGHFDALSFRLDWWSVGGVRAHAGCGCVVFRLHAVFARISPAFLPRSASCAFLRPSPFSSSWLPPCLRN